MPLSAREQDSIDPLTPLRAFHSAGEEPGVTPEVAALLQHVHSVNNQMKEHSQKVAELGAERRQTVTQLRELGVPWKVIARWAGTTEGALFKHQRQAK